MLTLPMTARTAAFNVIVTWLSSIPA